MTDTTSTTQETRPPAAGWQRIFALVYDPSLWFGEIVGMRGRRRALLSNARGRVVEIGAGTGLNIAHYPGGITELILTEPDAAMRRRLAHRVQRRNRVARIMDAPADRLPLADASVDTVVSTLVLCTVDDPERTLCEIARVLRPGGTMWIEAAFLQPVHQAPWHFFNITPFGLAHLCQRFDVVAVEQFGSIVEQWEWIGREAGADEALTASERQSHVGTGSNSER